MKGGAIVCLVLETTMTRIEAQMAAITMLGEMIEITRSHKGKVMATIMPTTMIKTKNNKAVSADFGAE